MVEGVFASEFLWAASALLPVSSAIEHIQTAAGERRTIVQGEHRWHFSAGTAYGPRADGGPDVVEVDEIVAAKAAQERRGFKRRNQPEEPLVRGLHLGQSGSEPTPAIERLRDWIGLVRVEGDEICLLPLPAQLTRQRLRDRAGTASDRGCS